MYSAVRLPGSYTRDEPAVLPHVLGDVIRVEDDGRVEVAEEDDAGDVEQVVQRHAPRQLLAHPSHEAVFTEHLRDRRRKRQNGRREDDRDDAAGVHLQRDVRARPAVHPPAYDPLGVLNGDAPVPALDEHDGGDHDDHQDDQRDQPEEPHLPGAQLIERHERRSRQADDDAREDDERHAVPDAALGDLLAEPHDERRTGRQRQHRQDAGSPSPGCRPAATRQQFRWSARGRTQCPATARR